MIVDNMTYEQIAREIDRARERTEKWFTHNKSQVHRRIVKGKLKFLTIKLPVGNPNPNCIISVYATGRMHAETLLIWREGPRGKHFYSCDYGKERFTYKEFTPHFVARYIERLHLDCTPTEAMVRYIQSIQANSCMICESGNAPTEKLDQSTRGIMAYVKSSEGVAVVDQIDNYWVYCTFLTDDMGIKEEKQVIEFLSDEFDYYVFKPKATSKFAPAVATGIQPRTETPPPAFRTGGEINFNRTFSPEKNDPPQHE